MTGGLKLLAHRKRHEYLESMCRVGYPTGFMIGGIGSTGAGPHRFRLISYQEDRHDTT